MWNIASARNHNIILLAAGLSVFVVFTLALCFAWRKGVLWLPRYGPLAFGMGWFPIAIVVWTAAANDVFEPNSTVFALIVSVGVLVVIMIAYVRKCVPAPLWM